MVISVLGANGTLLKGGVPELDSLLSVERCSKSLTAALNIHTRQCFKPAAFSEGRQKQREQNEVQLVVLTLNLATTSCIFLQGKEKSLSPARWQFHSFDRVDMPCSMVCVRNARDCVHFQLSASVRW